MREEEKPFTRFEAREARLPEDTRNTLVVGAIIHKLAEERKTTNKMFSRILARLEKMSELEKKVQELEASLDSKTLQKHGREERGREPESVLMELPLLPEADERILRFAAERGKCFAGDVQQHLNYRGRNAASSRLNRLAEKGFLKKVRVGRSIAFLPTSAAASFTSHQDPREASTAYAASTKRTSGKKTNTKAKAAKAKTNHASGERKTSMSLIKRWHGASFTHQTTSTC